jgi:hypothetical protein
MSHSGRHLVCLYCHSGPVVREEDYPCSLQLGISCSIFCCFNSCHSEDVCVCACLHACMGKQADIVINRNVSFSVLILYYPCLKFFWI